MKAFNGDKVFADLHDKIERKDKLTEKDKLNLIFLPLMKSNTDKNQMAINTVELASRIDDDKEKMLYIGAIVGISDKFIDKEYVLKLKERLKITSSKLDAMRPATGTDPSKSGEIMSIYYFLEIAYLK